MVKTETTMIEKNVKLYYKSQVRRFLIVTSSFDQLRQQCLQITELDAEVDVVLKYEDSELDKVSFSSDTELEYLLRLTADDNLLRLYMVDRDDDVADTGDIVADTSFYKKKKNYNFAYRSCRGRRPGRGRQEPRTLDARFVSHETIDINDQVPVNTPFEKTWSVRNTGSNSWPSDTVLEKVSKRDDIVTPNCVSVPPCAPHEEVSISVKMVSPNLPGEYCNYWKLKTSKGRKFGQRLRCQILATESS
eukprot:TRINITY_DN2337_c0_g1_i1.p1 TRINITY_DN2337_c0_g1~~TRINITY_DN2337_c0_g1_i1.p1  ORF type:complete len:247 (+),score=59.68 TRINITY_DN2337_c0_g1_i1:35-775(+)